MLRGVMWHYVEICRVMWRYVAFSGVFVALCAAMGDMSRYEPLYGLWWSYVASCRVMWRYVRLCAVM